MSGYITHPVSQIIHQLILSSGLGVSASASGWKTFFNNNPDSQDSQIAIIDRQGVTGPRMNFTGDRQTHHGFQVLVQGLDVTETHQKAQSIGIMFDELHNQNVTVDGVVYTIYSITRTGDILNLGKATQPNNRRNVQSINSVVALRQIT